MRIAMAYIHVRNWQAPSNSASFWCTTMNTSCTASSRLVGCTPKLRRQRQM
jgi:hypothetical protein